MYSCSVAGLKTSKNENIKNKWDCIDMGGTWYKIFLNFDDVPQAMATLFVVINSV
jgi:hypothetical protein